MHELLTPLEMADADRLSIEGGVPGYELMKFAGIGVTEALAELYPPARKVVVFAGPGNNGGDGFVAALELTRRGYNVTVGILSPPENLSGDAKLAFDDLKNTGIAIEPATVELVLKSEVILDAIFGAGLNRNVDGLPATILNAINQSGKPVISVDLPSGINGLSGAVNSIAVRADLTITFFRKKTGHILLPGRKYCGKVKVVDIGIDETVLAGIKPRNFRNCPQIWADKFPIPDLEDHKYSKGHTVVFSGPHHSTGAARLCAMAALRCGAGLVTVASPPDAVSVNASHLTSVMIRPLNNVQDVLELLKDERINTIAIGPGFGVGKRTREFVEAVLYSPRSIVLDADALTSFAEDPRFLFNLIADNDHSEIVMTPHHGEFSKLFGECMELDNKIDMARKAAETSGSVIVLKGADTVVANPEGWTAINDNAPPWLATAGSGDVLSGIISGLLSQSISPFDSAKIGVWLHGAAAQRIGPGLISEELIPALKPVIKDLTSEKTCD